GGARHRWRFTPARGQVPPTLRARCPVVPTGIVSSAFPPRLSAYRWSPEEFLQRGEVGAPRSMKMGTTPSPCLYDAAVRRALHSGNFRRPPTLPYASSSCRYRNVVRLPFDSGWPSNPRIDVMGQQRKCCV